jgi:RNA polymerase sigma factor (sigma-70 family)
MLTRLRRVRRRRRDSVFVTAREKPETFGVVFAEYSDAVLRYLARQTLVPEIAQELMAETFATALHDHALFSGTTDEEGTAWLFAIATHLLIPWQQRGVMHRHKRDKIGITVADLSLNEFELIEQFAELQRFGPVLSQALRALPVDEQEVLQLRLIEYQPYGSIAERLGLTPEETLRRASFALRQLAITLQQLGALSIETPPLLSELLLA